MGAVVRLWEDSGDAECVSEECVRKPSAVILLPRRVGKIVEGTMALLIKALFFFLRAAIPPSQRQEAPSSGCSLSWLIFFSGSGTNLEINTHRGETLRVKTQRGQSQTGQSQRGQTKDLQQFHVTLFPKERSCGKPTFLFVV